MAIALTGGHVSRAIDFYDTVGKYFIIGGTSPLGTDELNPPAPSVSDYKLKDVVGLKKVENAYLVVPDSEGSLYYRDSRWRSVPKSVQTTIAAPGVAQGATTITVTSMESIVVGSLLRINSEYEAKVVSINDHTLTLDKESPSIIAEGSEVLGGAVVEGAKYVYIEATLVYSEFPLVTYRQIGLCTHVLPNTPNILKSAAYSSTGNDEYTSLGVLEILDNRAPVTRDISMKETISMVIEF